MMQLPLSSSSNSKPAFERRIELLFDPSHSYSSNSPEWILTYNWDGYWKNILGWQIIASVSSLNNDSNYWSIQGIDYNNTIVFTGNTRGWTANSPTQQSGSGYSQLLAYGIKLKFIKTESPGALKPCYFELVGNYQKY